MAIFAGSLYADTVYLKNGRSLEGFIKSEDEEGLLLDVGFGTVGLRKDQVERIYRSSEEESFLLRKKWLQQKAAKPPEPKQQGNAKDAPRTQQVALSQEAGHVFVDALLNKKVKARLLLDTGASVIVLSAAIGKQLGVNMKKDKNIVTLQMADGRKTEAKFVSLGSVSIEGAEAKGVSAAVMLDSGDASYKDGLLGMSFLKQFNFTVDQKNRKLILDEVR
ncbi:MAG: retropepsin-like aspartic protease [Candidatus Omnitrophica bacterium]|nr:retropepsin-like aspartic protease [Candidatus Omnitrophota bacterium]